MAEEDPKPAAGLGDHEDLHAAAAMLSSFGHRAPLPTLGPPSIMQLESPDHFLGFPEVRLW